IAAHARRLALVAVLVRVFVSLEPALDVYLLSFDQIAGQRFGLLAPQIDVVPLGAFLPLARFVVPDFRRRHAEFRHGGAARRIAQLRVAPEIADQNDLVDASHRPRFYPSSVELPAAPAFVVQGSQPGFPDTS